MRSLAPLLISCDEVFLPFEPGHGWFVLKVLLVDGFKDLSTHIKLGSEAIVQK